MTFIGRKLYSGTKRKGNVQGATRPVIEHHGWDVRAGVGEYDLLVDHGGYYCNGGAGGI